MQAGSRGQGAEALTGRLGGLVVRARRMIWAGAAHELDREGASMHTYQLLAHLSDAGPLAQRDLADAVAQHPAGVCRQLDELEAQGLVERQRNESDRRKMRVEVSEAGRRWVEARRASVIEAFGRVLAPLSVREQRELVTLLAKLVGEGR